MELSLKWGFYGLFAVAAAVVVVSATVGTGVAPIDDTVDSGISTLSNLGTQPDDINETAVAYAAHERVNEARADQGLSPLSWGPALYDIASEHSETMARTGTYAHTINGSDHSDRYAAAGYECNQRSAENINRVFAATEFTSEGVSYDFEGNETKIGRGVVESWLDSPGHRRNLLDDRFSREGIGIAVAEDGSRVQVYATQNFC